MNDYSDLQMNTGNSSSVTSEQTKEILRILNNIPDLPKSVGPVDFYFTPYSVGLHRLTHINDIKLYMDKFQYLSEQASKLMFDFSTAEFIEEKLGPAFGMDAYQKIEVTEVIRDIVLGDIFIGDMIKETQTKLEIDENKAKDVASMVVAELFPPAIESIKRIQRLKFPLKIQEIAKSQQEKPVQPTQQPSGMGKNLYTAEELSKISLTQPTARPLPPRPDVSQQIKPIAPQPSTPPPSQRPSFERGSTEASRPNVPQQMRPPVTTAPPIPPPTPTPATKPSPQTPPNRPQFKVPDLSGIRVAPSTPSGKADESLEKELGDIANIIDLRSKTNE